MGTDPIAVAEAATTRREPAMTTSPTAPDDPMPDDGRPVTDEPDSLGGGVQDPGPGLRPDSVGGGVEDPGVDEAPDSEGGGVEEPGPGARPDSEGGGIEDPV
jgi:hypothetical protein